jgi:transposase
MALKIRTDYSAAALRLLAKGAEDVDQSRRLLSLAAAVEGMSREDAARLGGMDRQTLRDWVHRFNEQGPEGLRNVRHDGPAPRLSRDQQAELAALVEVGPDPSPTASCAGGVSICSASSRIASASTTTSAPSARY